jgi:glycerol-3-phosphate dehydrogenase
VTNVTIVGTGYMGTATTWPPTDNGHTVRLVGTHNEAIERWTSTKN